MGVVSAYVAAPIEARAVLARDTDSVVWIGITDAGNVISNPRRRVAKSLTIIIPNLVMVTPSLAIMILVQLPMTMPTPWYELITQIWIWTLTLIAER